MVNEEALSEQEQGMLKAGVAIDEPAFEDYFGFSEERRFMMPDGIQYMTYQIMNEGARAQYQKQTSRDVRLFKTSGDAQVKINPAEERRILILTSVTGWNLKRRGQNGQIEDVPFSQRGDRKPELEQWLNVANPNIVSALETEIRKANPWLLGDTTVEDIDEQIAELQTVRADLVARAEGKHAS